LIQLIKMEKLLDQKNQILRRINRLQEYEDAIRRIRAGSPGPQETEQFDNYLRYNSVQDYEHKIRALKEEGVRVMREIAYRKGIIEHIMAADTDPDQAEEDMQVIEAHLEALNKRLEKIQHKVQRKTPYRPNQILRYFEENEERKSLMETRNRDLEWLRNIELDLSRGNNEDFEQRKRFRVDTYKWSHSELKVL
jgi:hypothetical protein